LRKRTIGMLCVMAILALGTGIFTLVMDSQSFSFAYDPYTHTYGVIMNIGNPSFFMIGVIFCALGCILYLIGWMSALINMARAREFTWCILLLLCQWVCLVVYLFVAPEVSSSVYPQP
jgi:hypothetical protein